MIARRGFIFPTVVFAIAIMSVVVVAALTSATDDRRASRAVRESTLAQYAAEAGLRQTLGSWPSASVKVLNPGDSLDLGWQNLPNNARYRSVVHRVDAGGLQEYNVVVQGRRVGLNGGVITIVSSVGGVPLIRQAVFASGNISLNGGGLIDGYDSEEAAYNPAAPDTTANVWSNGNVTVSNTAVYGSASAAGSVTAGVGANMVGGATSSMTAASAPPIAGCPAGSYTSWASVPNGPGITYSQFSGVLTVSGGATLNLNGPNYYFSQVVLSGGSSLVVDPAAGGTEIIISDLLNISGGSVTNLTGLPPELSFSSCGSPGTPSTWTLSGGAGAAFSIYAPNHPVTVAGSGHIKGGVVAASYSAIGGAKLHYDAALARRSSDQLVVHPASWAELAGT